MAFEEKDEAKALGARWSPTEKKWFVPAGKRIADFDRWLPANLRTPEAYIYLIAAPRQCFSCRKIIEVIAFGIPLATEDDEASELEPGELRWHDPEKFDWLTVVPRLDVFPTEIREYVERRYGFSPAESRISSTTCARIAVRCKASSSCTAKEARSWYQAAKSSPSIVSIRFPFPPSAESLIAGRAPGTCGSTPPATDASF